MADACSCKPLTCRTLATGEKGHDSEDSPLGLRDDFSEFLLGIIIDIGLLNLASHVVASNTHLITEYASSPRALDLQAMLQLLGRES